MERRTFLMAAGAAAVVPAAAPVMAANSADEAAIKQRIVDWYAAFANPRVDRAYYLSFTTDDYLLLENGELLDKAGDLALLDSTPADQVRTDAFDFRKARADGDTAYVVYFLSSEIKDLKNGQRSRRYLESAVFRRENGKWRVAVLHSTRVQPPNG